MSDREIAKAAALLSARLASGKPGTDNVLRNVQGATTLAGGSLIPVAYNRTLNKEYMGQRLTQRRSIDAPEIAGRMALARMNRAEPGVLARAIV